MRSSSAMSVMGVSMQENIALGTAMNEVLQDSDKSGNSLKSIASNLTGVMTSAKDGTIQSNKTAKALKEIAGIDIWNKQTGEIKDMYSVMDELSGKWDTLTEAQQNALSNTIAGKTQINAFNALMSNFDTAKQIMKDYSSGEFIGSSLRENERYLDSIAGKSNAIKVTWQSIGNKLITSEATKGALDFVLAFSEGTETVLDKVQSIGKSVNTFGMDGTISNALTSLYEGFNLEEKLKLGTSNIGDWIANNLNGAFDGIGDKLSSVFKDLSNSDFFDKTLDSVSEILGKFGEFTFDALRDKSPLAKKLEEMYKDRQIEDDIDESRANISGIQDEIKGYQEQQKALESVRDEYVGLTKKQKLSNAEAERLSELTNFIAERSPDMVLGYKDDGTPILKNIQLQNRQLENQIKLKQQQQRIEENLLATQVQQSRTQNKKDYDKNLKEYQNMGMTSTSDRKETWWGEESMQDYAKRTIENNRKIAEDNKKTYEQRLKDHQQYVDDEKAIQQKYINQMMQNQGFKSASQEMQSSLATLADSLDWSQLTDSQANSFANQLANLGDKFVSTTDKMGDQSKAIKQLGQDYVDNKTNLMEYTKGLTEAYETAGKFDAESFTAWHNGAKSYLDMTGDIVGFAKEADRMAKTLEKVTGISADTWSTAIMFDPAPIDASNQALQRFLKANGTSVKNMGLEKTDSLVDQFANVQTSYMQMLDTVADGTITAEYLVEATVGNPDCIQNLAKELASDGKVEPEEIELVMNAQMDILNKGEISDETWQQIADYLNMDVQEVKAKFNVEAEVTGLDNLKEQLNDWNNLTTEEKKNLFLDIQSQGFENFKMTQEEWNSLSDEEKQLLLRQLIEGEGYFKEAINDWDSLSAEEKELVMRLTTQGSDEYKMTVDEWNSLSVEEKELILRQLVEGKGEIESAKQSIEGLPTEKDTKINITEGNPGVTGKIREDLEGVPKQTTAKVDVEVGGDASGGSSIKDKIKKLLGFGNGETTKVPVNVEIDAKPTSGVNLKEKIKSLLGFGSGSTTEQITVDAKVGEVDTSSISNVNPKPVEVEAKVGEVDTSSVSNTTTEPIEIEAKVGKVDTSSVSSTKVTPIEIEAKIGKVDTSSASSTKVTPIEIEAKIGKVDTSSISSINVQPIEVKANVSSALGQINSIKSALNGIQTKNITVNASGNALGQINSIKSAMAGLQSKSIAINTTVSGTAQINALKSAIASLQGKSVSVNATTNGTPQVTALTSAINTVQGKTVSVTANVTGTGAVNSLKSAINAVKSKSVTVKASTSGTSSVQSLASAIASVKSKTVTVSVTKKVTTTESGSSTGGRRSIPSQNSNSVEMLSNTPLANIPVTASAQETSLSSSPMSTRVSSSATRISSSDILPSLDIDISPIKGLEEALERLSTQLDLLDEKANLAFGEKKVQLLQQQVNVLREQQAIQEQMRADEQAQARTLRNWLSGKGFSFDAEGNISNYNEKLIAMEKNVESLQDKYDSLNEVTGDNKNESAIKSAKKAYESANEELSKAKKYLEEYFATNNKEITGALEKWYEYENAIVELQKEMRDIQNQQIRNVIDSYEGKIDILEAKKEIAPLKDQVKYLEEQERLYLAQQSSIETLTNQLKKQIALLHGEGEESVELNKELNDLTAQWYELNTTIQETRQEIEDLKTTKIVEPLRNALQETSYKLDEVNGKLEILEESTKFAQGSDKIVALRDKIELLNRKLVTSKEEFKNLQSLMDGLKSNVFLYGFKLDGEGLITNYDEVLNGLVGRSVYERAKETADEYMELIQNDYVDTKLSILETQNEIKDALKEQLEITEEIEGEITKILEDEYERREKEIEKHYSEKIKLLEKEKEAYEELWDERDYEKSIAEQVGEIAELQKKLDIARKDNSVSGLKRQKELQDEILELQKELQETTEEKIRDDYLGNIDKEIERLEEEEESMLEILDEKFSEENIGKMVAEAMSSGMIEINGEVKTLQDALMESVDSTAQGYSVMSNIIKEELCTNLQVALSTMKDILSVYSQLGVEKYGDIDVKSRLNPIYSEGGSSKAVTIGDTNIVINGNVDDITLDKIEELIKEENERMLNKITQGI